MRLKFCKGNRIIFLVQFGLNERIIFPKAYRIVRARRRELLASAYLFQIVRDKII